MRRLFGAGRCAGIIYYMGGREVKAKEKIVAPPSRNAKNAVYSTSPIPPHISLKFKKAGSSFLSVFTQFSPL